MKIENIVDNKTFVCNVKNSIKGKEKGLRIFIYLFNRR